MKNNNKVRIAFKKYGDSRDKLEMSLYGYREFKELSLKEKKEVVKELSLSYDREDLKQVIKNIAVLENQYGEHLSNEERYHALRKACDWINLDESDTAAIRFVIDEMDSLVGAGNWWWEDGRSIRAILPKTDVFDKEENE